MTFGFASRLVSPLTYWDIFENLMIPFLLLLPSFLLFPFVFFLYLHLTVLCSSSLSLPIFVPALLRGHTERGKFQDHLG